MSITLPVSLYEYVGIVRSVYDADTIRVDVDLGFHIWRYNESIRFFGINAWEVTGEQRVKGLAARDALRDMVLFRSVFLRTMKDKQEKYGRYLAVVYTADGLNINRWLVEQGHAVPYMDVGDGSEPSP